MEADTKDSLYFIFKRDTESLIIYLLEILTCRGKLKWKNEDNITTGLMKLGKMQNQSAINELQRAEWMIISGEDLSLLCRAALYLTVTFCYINKCVFGESILLEELMAEHGSA